MKNTSKIIEWRNKIYIRYTNKGKVLNISTGFDVKEKKKFQNKIDEKFNELQNILIQYKNNEGIFPPITYVKQKLNIVENSKDNINTLYQRFFNLKSETIKNIEKNQIALLRDLLKNYNMITEIDINKLDDNFVNYFQKFMFTKISDNTHGKVITYLKSFLQYSFEQNLVKRYKIDYKKYREKIKPYKPTIETLTLDEIDFLFEKYLNTNDKYKTILGILIFSCYTALRYSDIQRMNKQYITKDLIIIDTLKTGEECIIPINERVNQILKDNNYNLNHYSLKNYIEKLREMIKSYSEEYLPFKEIINKRKYVNKKEIIESVPRYKMFASHIGRRSFITNCVNLGVPPNQIISVTGHKDIGVILTNYINKKHKTESNLPELLLRKSK